MKVYHSLVIGTVLLLSCGQSAELNTSGNIEPEDVLPNTAGMVVMGVMATMATDADAHERLRVLREECRTYVDAIAVAQMHRIQDGEDFVYTSGYVPDDRPGNAVRDWPEGTRFDTLGWSPSEAVRGSYRVVERTSDDFLIACITDADGDGHRASWTATRYLNVERTTPDDIY